MGAVIRLVNGSRATAREPRYRAHAIYNTSKAKAIQNHIFGGTPYEGLYEVIPTDYEQCLDTSGKVMRDDVTVHKVPYAETSNESGGFTVSILS